MRGERYAATMRVLVTGATGKVGNAVAARLLERGEEVVALVRDVAAARERLPAGIEAVAGDVTEPPSVHRACEGVEGVFNCMGIYEQWLPDPGRFEEVNAQGALSVIAAARQAGARRCPHVDLRRLPRGAGRHPRRNQARRLPEGHRLRALQA